MINLWDPLDPVCQDVAHSWLMRHGGDAFYERTKRLVAKFGATKLMERAIDDAQDDEDLILTWCVIMRAKRDLSAAAA